MGQILIRIVCGSFVSGVVLWTPPSGSTRTIQGAPPNAYKLYWLVNGEFCGSSMYILWSQMLKCQLQSQDDLTSPELAMTFVAVAITPAKSDTVCGMIIVFVVLAKLPNSFIYCSATLKFTASCPPG